MKVAAAHCFPLHGVAREGEALTVADPPKDGRTLTDVCQIYYKSKPTT